MPVREPLLTAEAIRVTRTKAVPTNHHHARIRLRPAATHRGLQRGVAIPHRAVATPRRAVATPRRAVLVLVAAEVITAVAAVAPMAGVAEVPTLEEAEVRTAGGATNIPTQRFVS
jgi:hypothetical protein